MFGFNKKKDITSHALEDVARGMQYSVNSVQEIVEQHYINMLSRFFDKDHNPVTVKYNLTPGHVIEVPLITLVKPTSLSLEEISMEMRIRVDEARATEMKGEKKEFIGMTGFQVSMAPSSQDKRKSNEIDIVMKFKAGDPPEGVSRIIDEFTSKLLPKRVDSQTG